MDDFKKEEHKGISASAELKKIREMASKGYGTPQLSRSHSHHVMADVLAQPSTPQLTRRKTWVNKAGAGAKAFVAIFADSLKPQSEAKALGATFSDYYNLQMQHKEKLAFSFDLYNPCYAMDAIKMLVTAEDIMFPKATIEVRSRIQEKIHMASELIPVEFVGKGKAILWLCSDEKKNRGCLSKLLITFKDSEMVSTLWDINAAKEHEKMSSAPLSVFLRQMQSKKKKSADRSSVYKV